MLKGTFGSSSSNLFQLIIHWFGPLYCLGRILDRKLSFFLLFHLFLVSSFMYGLWVHVSFPTLYLNRHLLSTRFEEVSDSIFYPQLSWKIQDCLWKSIYMSSSRLASSTDGLCVLSSVASIDSLDEETDTLKVSISSILTEQLFYLKVF